MIPIETARTIVRLWQERDRPAFHRLNCDEAVMRFFPFRRDRAASDAMMDRLVARFEADGITFFALEEKASGLTIGMVGLAHLGSRMPMAPGVEIGWRLLPEAWGKGYASEAASACLDAAFRPPVAFPQIVSLCVAGNDRSEAVMQRLGFRHAGDFDHPDVDPATHPHLVQHRLYQLEAADWRGSPGRDTAACLSSR